MTPQRLVIGQKTKLFLEGTAFTTPSAGTAGVAAKPDLTDPKWIDPGQIKWTLSPDHKTEVYMEAAPGSYVPTEETVLSKSIKYKGKLEKASNLAYQLQQAAASIPSSGAGGIYNPLAGSPKVNCWLHIEERDQNNVLVNVVDNWVSLKISGDVNKDEKASETPVEALVLNSTLNVGTLS